MSVLLPALVVAAATHRPRRVPAASETKEAPSAPAGAARRNHGSF